jgi:hypothetical protein
MPVGIVDRPPEGVETDVFIGKRVPDYVGQALPPGTLGEGLPYAQLRRAWRHLRGAAELLDPSSW